MIRFAICTLVLLCSAITAPPKQHGYSVFDSCGRLVFAAGMDTGVTVRNPVTGDLLRIEPGASVAWSYPDEEEDWIES